jgi:sulfatase maturation enzyme AslB (radical SAM superfamily)
MPAAGGVPSPPTVATDALAFFRFGRIAGKVVITTDAGDWAFLSEPEFAQLLAGEIADGHPRFAALQSGGFLRQGLDLDALAQRLARRVGHVARGPERHVVTMTRRSTGPTSAAPGARLDLDRATAERIVEVALQSNSPSVTFEFQALAGEPLLNLDGIRHFVAFARTTNERAAGKRLRFRLLSNLSGMTEEAAEWLITNEVAIRTSLDGPAELHDWSRKYTAAGAHADVVRWLAWFDRRYREIGRDPDVWHVDARLTTTRRTLAAWREVVDEYAARGLRSIELRPLSPLGFDAAAWETLGYGVDAYLAFYDRAFAHLLELNRTGVHLAERTASGLLNGILPSGDPAACEVRSPCAAGTSELAYDVDGRVFPGDEARRVDTSGDPISALGNIRNLSIAEIVRHPTVRAIATASLLDAQPMCADAWNKPFCGTSPVSTYVREGDLFGQPARSVEVKDLTNVARTLFTLLANESDRDTRAILERWAASSQLR